MICSSIRRFRSSLLAALLLVFGIPLAEMTQAGASAVISTIPGSGAPTMVAGNTLTGRVYVGNFGGGSVSIINQSTNAVQTVSVAPQLNAIAVDESTNTIYATSWSNSELYVIDGTTNTVTATIGVPRGPQGIAVDSAAHRVFVATWYDAKIAVIDSQTNSVLSTISEAGNMSSISVDTHLHRLFATMNSLNSVAVVDETTGTLIDTISVGSGPDCVATNSTTHTTYVRNRESNNVSVVDNNTDGVIATIGSVPTSYGTLSVDPRTNRIYVAGWGSQKLTVIDGFTQSVIDTITVGSGPYGVSFSTETDVVYVANQDGGSISVVKIDPPPPTVTYDANGGDGGTSAIENFGSDAIAQAPTTLSRSGYNFLGWAVTNSASSALSSYSVTGTVTLFAVWSPITYSVTYDANGGDGGTSAIENFGSDAIAQAPTTLSRSGYNFLGWAVTNSASSALSSYSVTGTVTLFAVWSPITYSVTYDLGGGDGTLPTQGPLMQGATFDIASSAGLSWTGYTFSYWSDGTSHYAPGSRYTMGQSPVSLTAVWSRNIAPPVPDLPSQDLGVPTTFIPSNTISSQLTLGSGATSASITVPPGALPEGTTLSVYPVVNSSNIEGSLPVGETYIVSLVVTWIAPDGSSPPSTSPLTMTISNPGIKAGYNIYMIVGGTPTLLGTATVDGSITFSFSEDPVLTVSAPSSQNPDPSPGGNQGGGDGGVAAGGVSGGVTPLGTQISLASTGSNLSLVVMLGVALSLFGVLLTAPRKAKARRKQLR